MSVDTYSRLGFELMNGAASIAECGADCECIYRGLGGASEDAHIVVN